MTRYAVFRYSDFPKQDVRDLMMAKFFEPMEATAYSIKLNKEYSSRYYWRKLESNEL